MNLKVWLPAEIWVRQTMDHPLCSAYLRNCQDLADKTYYRGIFAIDVLLPHAMQLSLVIDHDLLAVGPTFSLVYPLLISCPESLIL